MLIDESTTFMLGGVRFDIYHLGPAHSPEDVIVVLPGEGVVFSGDHQGTFFAADSKTGKKLFQFQTGAPIYAPPTTYMIDNRQYVIRPAGSTFIAFALPQSK